MEVADNLNATLIQDLVYNVFKGNYSIIQQDAPDNYTSNVNKNFTININIEEERKLN